MAGRHETLWGVIDDLENHAAELKVTLTPENWADLKQQLEGPMSYGETRRKSIECATKKGKPTRAFFVVCIMRTDAGIYELMCNT